MRVLIIILIMFFFLSIAHVSGEIIVKQGSDGRIIVTNSPGGSEASPSPGRAVKYTVSSYSTTQIPTLYDSKISDLSKKHKVPEDLIVAVVRAESGFNPFAVSRKGAVGIMQLMKDTAKKYGVTNRYDVDQNLDAGVRHLKYLYTKYNKDLKIVLAAYNAGEEAVKKYNGVPPYNETRNYIRKVRQFMGLSSSESYYSGGRTTIFKYKTSDGRIVLSDTPPADTSRSVEIVD
jgi:hypothetical protein